MVVAIYMMTTEKSTYFPKQPCNGFGDFFVVQVMVLAGKKVDLLQAELNLV